MTAFQIILTGLVLGLVFCGFASVYNYFSVNRLKESGVVTDVREEVQAAGKPEISFSHYYFLQTDSSKVWLIQPENDRSAEAISARFRGSTVIYDPEKPENYILLSSEGENLSYSWTYYLLLLPTIIALFYYIAMPAKMHYRMLRFFGLQ
ncbi:MAG: hypothetical protein R3B47_17140 [Bacteroidia bacterium]